MTGRDATILQGVNSRSGRNPGHHLGEVCLFCISIREALFPADNIAECLSVIVISQCLTPLPERAGPK